MPRDPIYHRAIERVRREERLAAPARRRVPRDSLATLLLGTLSLGIGLVTLGATLAGIAARPLAGWNRPVEVLAEATPRQFEVVWDSELGRQVSRVKLVVATTILVPSPSCVAVALIGAALGGAGVALGLRRRRASWSSGAGLLSNLPVAFIGAAYELIMNLLY
jgi:hypothetical protein